MFLECGDCEASKGESVCELFHQHFILGFISVTFGLSSKPVIDQLTLFCTKANRVHQFVCDVAKLQL